MKTNRIICYILILIAISTFFNFKVIENMIDNITTVDWSDPHKECKSLFIDNCQENKNCFWHKNLQKCVNYKNRRNPCDSYNNKFLNNDPYLKNKMCKSIGCIKNDKICLDPLFKNHLEYCYQSKNKDTCNLMKQKCLWNEENNICLSKNDKPLDFCKQFNDINIKYNAKCINKKFRNNFNNCYIDLKRNIFTQDVIPNTGLKSFRKLECEKAGCNFLDLVNQENGLCVSKDLKDEENMCINYYDSSKRINPPMCKKIGCNHYYGLNRKNGGICVSSKQIAKGKSEICKAITNVKKCIEFGCGFEQGRCR